MTPCVHWKASKALSGISCFPPLQLNFFISKMGIGFSSFHIVCEMFHGCPPVCNLSTEEAEAGKGKFEAGLGHVASTRCVEDGVAGGCGGPPVT